MINLRFITIYHNQIHLLLLQNNISENLYENININSFKYKPQIIWRQGINTKKSKKRTNKYVTIHIHDREVTWNESISNSFDVTISSNDTQINFADIINV